MEHFQAWPHQKLGAHKLSFESSTNEPKVSTEFRERGLQLQFATTGEFTRSIFVP